MFGGFAVIFPTTPVRFSFSPVSKKIVVKSARPVAMCLQAMGSDHKVM
jgi:hypothetical protein